MVPPGMNLEGTKALVGTKLAQLRSNLAQLEAQLEGGRAFLLGDEACGAGSAFHPLMFLSTHPRTAALLEPLPARARVDEARARDRARQAQRRWTRREAIRSARDAEPATFIGEPVLPDGMALGTPVVVLPDEYGSGNVAGTLMGVHEIAVRRRTERAGEVVVHFPREDYSVVATG